MSRRESFGTRRSGRSSPKRERVRGSSCWRVLVVVKRSSVGSKSSIQSHSMQDAAKYVFLSLFRIRNAQEIEMSLRHTAAILGENQDALINSGSLLESDNTTIGVLQPVEGDV